MKMKRNPISNAVYKALFTGFVASSAFGTVALAQDNDEDQGVEEQGKITVTGSRIKRSDVEGALPVTVISREQIELSGESNAADFIRNLTFNSSGSFRPTSGTSWQSISTVSLRGLGASRTLVLIDGRRMSKSPVSGSNQDLNAIPAGAIERIEILTDGASAVYGSDAIGGVINVITRTDYEGAEIMLGGAEVSLPSEGGDREEGSIAFGAASDRGSLIFGHSWNDREIIFARHNPWYFQGHSAYGVNYITPSFTLAGLPGACDAITSKYPDTGFHTNGSNCAYDYNLEAAEEASIDNSSYYAKAKYNINDNWQVWTNAMIAETESFGRYAPSLADGPRYIPVAPDSPNNISNPNSPHYVEGLYDSPETIFVLHRFDALGNRDTTVTNRLTNLQAGATGMIGDVELDFGVSRDHNRSFEIGNGYLMRSNAEMFVNSGEYSFWDPYAADADVLSAMRVTTSRVGIYDSDAYFGSGSFDVFDTSAGPVSMVIGAEYREDKYSDQYDSLSEAGQVGGSAGNSAAGQRDVTSLFFEGLVPLTDNLELNLAGRYDHYSDFGSNFSPKASLRFQPMDNLTLRASYGQGFRAPTLPSLYGKRAYSAEFVDDPVSCAILQLTNCDDLQVAAYSQGNPDLSAEESDQFSIGVAYEPTDWFNFTLDYYNTEIDNRLRQFGANYLLDLEREGLPLPPGLEIIRLPSGLITEITYGPGNQGTLETSGLDANLRFNFDVFGGQVSSNLQVSHVLDMSIDGGRDNVEDPGLPSTRAVLSNVYSYGDWSFAWNVNMIGDQYDEIDTEDGEFVGRSGHVPTWVTHDVQLNYHAPWNGKITVGAQNVGEKEPLLGLGFVDGRDYDRNLYHGYGRITYVRYTQTF
ncbi:MAG: TonB-dependent receptor plug domain-containing protein [Marinicella pacifica]